MSGTKTPPLAMVLPLAAARLLQQAAVTPVIRDDPMARQKAIEAALVRVRRIWPQYFRQDVR